MSASPAASFSRSAETRRAVSPSALRVTELCFPRVPLAEALGECTPPCQGAPRGPRLDERADEAAPSQGVPFGPRLARELGACLALRDRRRSPDAPMFPGVRGPAVSTNTLRRIFTRLCRNVGIGRSESGALPRVHDLRHSFAVATLLHWYEAGIKPTGKLLQLSTFLGHAKIKATAVYLTITWELLHEAKCRFAQVAAAAIPEVAS